MLSSLSCGVIKKIDNNNIYNLSSTEHGSSVAPIINLDTLNVIGIHQAYHIKEICNQGTNLKDSINNFNRENQIYVTLKIDPCEVNKKNIFSSIY